MTILGITDQTGAINRGNGEDTKSVSRFSATASFTAAFMTMWYSGSPDLGEYVRYVVYDDNAGVPGDLLGYTTAVGVTSINGPWISLDLLSPVEIVNGNDYWLGTQFGGGAGGFGTNTGSAGDYKANTDIWGTSPADPFGTPSATEDWLICVNIASDDELRSNPNLISSGGLAQGGKILRTSLGTKVTLHNSGNTIRVYYGVGVTPNLTSANDTDIHGTGSLAIGYFNAAIDANDNIHIVSSCVQEATRDVAYSILSGIDSTPSWGAWEEVADYTETPPTKPGVWISIDGNNKPHIAYIDVVKQAGAAADNVYYTEKTGASWAVSTQIGVRATKTDAYYAPGLIHRASDSLFITYMFHPGASAANDMAYKTWTSGGGWSGETIYLVDDWYCDNCAPIVVDTDTLLSFYVSGGSSWTTNIHQNDVDTGYDTWNTLKQTTISKRCSAVADGADHYVFYIDVNRDVHLLSNDGAGWTDEGVIDPGTFTTVLGGWSYNNLNNATSIDYLFGSSVGVHWGEFSLAGDTVDDLTATGITANPVLGTPTIGQEHDLTATGITANPVVGTPTISEIVDLTANGITANPVLGTPAIGQIHALDAVGITADPVVGTPSIGQEHALDAVDITADPILETPIIGQIHTLGAVGITADPVVGTPVLTSTAALTAVGITANPILGTPALTQTQTVSVAASTDDAIELISGAVDLDRVYLHFSSNQIAEITTGIRFLAQIPADATIISALLTLQADATIPGTDTVDITIKGEKSTASSTFTTTTDDITDRPQTTVGVAWSPPPWAIGQQYTLPELKTIIQELVNQPGWTESSAVSFIFLPDVGLQYRKAESYDGGVFYSKLVIEYTESLEVEYDLTAVGITVNPIAGTPDIGQEHDLTATGITTTPITDASDIGQTHDLDAVGITTTPVLGVPTVTDVPPGADNLVAEGIATTPVMGIPTIGQEHVLDAVNIITTPAVDTPILGSIADLDAINITTTPILDVSDIGQEHDLDAVGITTTPVLDTPTISSSGIDNLNSVGITTTPVLGVSDIAQTHAITAVGIITTPVLGIPAISPSWIGSPPSGTDVYILDASLATVGIIEDYYSLIWTERYSEAGEFELELPIEYAYNDLIAFGNFLYIKASDTIMIIEDLKPSTSEDKTSLLVNGQSSENILNRRVLLDPINVSGNAETTIYSLMADHITSPTDNNREIILFKDTFPSPVATYDFDEQFEIDTVYNLVKTICKGLGLGFKIVNENYLLAFSVYEGKDRSFDQVSNPYVIFSDNFDNVVSSSFYESEKDKVNLVLVATDDVVHDRTFVWKTPEPMGLDRFETVLETTIDRDVDAPPLSDSEVLAIITTRGEEVLEENKLVGLFEGDFDIEGNFKYGIDFFMGDIVQCNLEGSNVKARIIELVRSYTTEGEKSYVAMDFII